MEEWGQGGDVGGQNVYVVVRQHVYVSTKHVYVLEKHVCVLDEHVYV